jgi:hypothetical protein
MINNAKKTLGGRHSAEILNDSVIGGERQRSKEERVDGPAFFKKVVAI